MTRALIDRGTVAREFLDKLGKIREIMPESNAPYDNAGRNEIIGHDLRVLAPNGSRVQNFQTKRLIRAASSGKHRGIGKVLRAR